MSSPQQQNSTSMHIDLDSVCKALHVQRDAFVQAASRSAAADEAAQSTAQSVSQQGSPQLGPSSPLGGYGSASNAASSSVAVPINGAARSHLSTAAESEALLPGSSVASTSRLGTGANAPKQKRLTAKTLVMHQQEQQQGGSTSYGPEAGAAPADAASDNVSSNSKRPPNIRTSIMSDGQSQSPDVAVPIPADVRRILAQNAAATNQQHQMTHSSSGVSGGAVLSGTSDRTRPTVDGGIAPVVSTTMLSNKEFAIEENETGRLHMRFAERYGDEDDDEDEESDDEDNADQRSMAESSKGGDSADARLADVRSSRAGSISVGGAPVQSAEFLAAASAPGTRASSELASEAGDASSQQQAEALPSALHHTSSGLTQSQANLRREKKQKRRVRFTDDVIDQVNLERTEGGGVLVKVAFRRPSWLFWVLGFSVIAGAAGWYITVGQAHRATEQQQSDALFKIAAIRSWAMLLVALVGLIFVFPARSSDWAFARDPANIMRLLFVAVLHTGAMAFVYFALSEHLSIAPLIWYSLLALFFVVASRYSLYLLGMSSASTTWYDLLSAGATLAASCLLPLHFGYSASSCVALALAAGGGLLSGTYSWKTKSLRPYFSQGIVVVTVSLLSAIVFTVPLATISSLREAQVPFIGFPPGPANESAPNTTSNFTSSTTTTTTTTTLLPNPEGKTPPPSTGRQHHLLTLHMDSDSFILALLSGVCEGLRLFAHGLVAGFIDVPAHLTLSLMATPVYMLFFAAQGLPGVGVPLSVAVSIGMAIVICVQWYFGEGHRRETHLHLSSAPQKKT